MMIDDDSLAADIAVEEGQLRVELAEAEALAAAATDPQRLRAEKEADMLLFLNLVRLAEKLLPYTLPALFAERWVFSVTERLIQLSNRHPLLSGLYRLLTVALRICDKVDYFRRQRTCAGDRVGRRRRRRRYRRA
jgi:hypothetical protein